MQHQLSSLHVVMEQNSNESEKKLQQLTSDNEHLIEDKKRYQYNTTTKLGIHHTIIYFKSANNYAYCESL